MVGRFREAYDAVRSDGPMLVAGIPRMEMESSSERSTAKDNG